MEAQIDFTSVRVRLRPDIYEQLKKLAKDDEKTISEELEKLVENETYRRAC